MPCGMVMCSLGAAVLVGEGVKSGLLGADVRCFRGLI